MGMAASQATLLTLTSRLHDIEYKAQNIQNQKIALATQQDELYTAYCEALDATKIQVAFDNPDGSKNYQDATFSTLCGYNPDRPKQYSLKDANTGHIIVDADTKEAYDEYSNDKYVFAFAMLGMAGQDSWTSLDNVGDGGFIGIGTSLGNEQNDGNENFFMTEVEQAVFDKHVGTDPKLSELYDRLTDTCDSADSSTQDKRDALNTFRDYLYNQYSPEIYQYMRLNKLEGENNTDPESATAEFDEEYPENFPKGEFEYYVHLFEEIKSAGGCQVVDPQFESGRDGNTWLNNMVGSGRVIIEVYNSTKKEWTETSVATSSNENYLQEVQDDKDLKKAEAEYQHKLNIINRKDTKFDRDLSKLETERTAITTEMESVKKVRDDNEQKNFGIFG